MDISDMRCISYEAVLPQRADEQLKSHPYSEMVWKLEIDRLRYAPKLPELSIPDLVEFSLFKDPGSKVLEYGSYHTHKTLFNLEESFYTIAEATDEIVKNVAAMIKPYKNAKVQNLDLSLDLESQGITASQYHLVIGPSNPSGTRDVACLSSLSAPGGRLVWESSTEPDLAVLESTGLTGIDFSIPRAATTVFAASKPTDGLGTLGEAALREVQVVYRKEPNSMFHVIQEALKLIGWYTRVSKLVDCKTNVGDHVVMLSDLEGPLVSTLQEEELVAIQPISNTASSVLWVTTGGLLTGQKPEYAITGGLIRVITSEQAALDLATLNFDLDNTNIKQISNMVASAINEQSNTRLAHENETCVDSNLAYISRLVPNTQVNETYSKEQQKIVRTAFNPDSHFIGKV